MQLKNNIKKINNAGFTIPEVLMAISISSLVVLMIASAIFYSQKAYTQGESSAEMAQNARIILERMSREIRQAKRISTSLPETIDEAVNEIQFQDGHVPVVAESANVRGASSNTIVLSSVSSATDNHYKDLYIKIISGDGVGQTRKITNYTGSSKTAQVGQSWATTPSTNSVYKIDSTFNYIHYYRDAENNILREVVAYCFSDNSLVCVSPESYVSFDSEPSEGQDMLKVTLESPQIIGQYVFAMKFYGQNIVNIFLSLKMENQTANFQTGINGRNF
jgi:prepilin-type N-terminal cleavage/methylation domain-containing protein